MSAHDPEFHTRRDFLGRVGQLGVVAALPGATLGTAVAQGAPKGDWDLSWVKQLEKATDAAVFDTVNLGEGIALQLATRYLDGCDAVYGAGKHQARVVLNLRVRAIPMGLKHEIWDRYELGTEYDIKEPGSTTPIRRNPYLTLAAGANPALGSVQNLIERRGIVLVCDFALGHMATRVATKLGKPPEEVHGDMLAGLIPGAYAVPSGLFGLARAQNAGCAYLSGNG